jgi:hypothetical protein
MLMLLLGCWRFVDAELRRWPGLVSCLQQAMVAVAAANNKPRPLPSRAGPLASCALCAQTPSLVP